MQKRFRKASDVDRGEITIYHAIQTLMSDSYKECVIKLSVIYLIGNLPYFTIYKTKKKSITFIINISYYTYLSTRYLKQPVQT